jgi:hypothetical protein
VFLFLFLFFQSTYLFIQVLGAIGVSGTLRACKKAQSMCPLERKIDKMRVRVIRARVIDSTAKKAACGKHAHPASSGDNIDVAPGQLTASTKDLNRMAKATAAHSSCGHECVVPSHNSTEADDIDVQPHTPVADEIHELQ